MRPDFKDQAEAIIAQLPDQWDLIYWGWVYRCYLIFELCNGGPAVIAKTSHGWEQGYKPYMLASDLDSQPYRCYAAWNSFCYTVSPRGASKLIKLCRPIRDENGRLPLQNDLFAIYGIDAKMAAITTSLQAYVAIPPLAMQPYDPKNSDISPQKG